MDRYTNPTAEQIEQEVIDLLDRLGYYNAGELDDPAGVAERDAFAARVYDALPGRIINVPARREQAQA